MIKLAVAGCTGRMGRLLISAINENPNLELAGALTRPENPLVGQGVGRLVDDVFIDVTIADDPKVAFKDADVIIDFSHPDSLDANLEAALALNKAYVICLTGLKDSQKETLESASWRIPMLIAPNTSLAIALLRKLSLIAAKTLGRTYDISILEHHHRKKKDAPSGTTLSLAGDLAKLEGLTHNKPPYPSCSPRPEGHIECAVLRGGTAPGMHTVLFSGDLDSFTLSHQTFDPSLFAEGAIRAAEWLFQKPAGLYAMEDVVEIPA